MEIMGIYRLKIILFINKYYNLIDKQIKIKYILTFIFKILILYEEGKMRQETRKERFKRLAEKRTNNVIKNIRILGNCSNRSSYEYAKSEVDKIFNTISSELRLAGSKFTFRNNPKENYFRLN